MVRILIIDNYDSFTFNLYQYVGEILSLHHAQHGFEIIVKRNNEVTLDDIKKLNPDRIIISPGPGTPEDEKYFGICRGVILELGKTIPVLGVCLGMQGIAFCFGGKIVRAKEPVHGKISTIYHDGIGLYQDIPQNLDVMRYHSLMVETITLPDCLEITSIVNNQDEKYISDLSIAAFNGNEIMGIRHKEYPIEGIQFHPESFATEGGHKLLSNFIW